MAIRDHLLTHDIFMHHYTLTQIHIDTDKMDFYSPKTKFAKVMFSQVFVCPQGEGLGGSLSGRHPAQRPPPRQRPPPGQRPPLNKDLPWTVTDGQYASYWNAFLLFELTGNTVLYISTQAPHWWCTQADKHTHTHARRGTTLTGARSLSDFVADPRRTIDWCTHAHSGASQ